MPLFGVSYFGNRFISHAKADLARIATTCDYVVHTVNETDLTYHKAVLAKLFAESRRLGLETWADPWGLGGVFGGESASQFLVTHRDSWQTMSDGRIMPIACLNRPEWRSYVKEWVLSVRDMGAQVIFWDEPHIAFDLESEWAGIYACVCPVCQQNYKSKYGSPMPGRLNDQAREFRRDYLRDFLEDVMGFARSKGMKNALCLYAFKGFEEYDRIWSGAAALKNLDIFGCDPYWRWRRKRDPKIHVDEFAKKVAEDARRNGKQSQIWIQAMRFPAGVEAEVEHAIQAAIAQGITHIAAWSFDGGELLDTVLSERPGEVWQAVEVAFLKHREAKAVPR